MEYVFGEVRVACTNTDRVVFPEVGITKGDVLAYYRDVASVIVPELAGRPITIERFTKGVGAGGFYQKHAQKHYPSWIGRVDVAHKTPVTYPLCDSAAALVYLANQGGFVFHVWTSKLPQLEQPDTLVFDLDPPDGATGLALARQVARLVRDVLESLALPAFIKVTGSKGLHVVAPLDGSDTFHEVARLTSAISASLCAAHPQLVTQEFYKKDRGGRLFLDTMRNTPGATVVAPYSLRGKPTAPVAAPIEWDELDDVTPDGISLRDVRARLDRRGDPWKTLRASPGSIRTALDALAATPSR